MKIRVALTGNPNSGKTTVFNALTGSNQHVGNYPGVTVEKKVGRRSYAGHEMEIVDLPGTYSLTAHSPDELVARNFLINEKPDVVVDIIDSANLERNLYLATQLLELNVPLVMAMNMSDMAERSGASIDYEKLGGYFGAEVVATVGSTGHGMTDLLNAVVKKAGLAKRPEPLRKISYGDDIEAEIERISAMLPGACELVAERGARWVSIKLLEQDAEVAGEIRDVSIVDEVEKSVVRIRKICGDSPAVIMAERRYGFISSVYESSSRQSPEARHDVSDAVDKILLNRVWGIPIFLLMMYLVFKLTFTVGDPLMGLVESMTGGLSGFISGFWEEGSESMLRSLLVDGVIGGVGGVVIFLPNIVLLFLAIAVLEDSGYMARAAFIMDRAMKKTGLHGRSFIPMIIGFGCSIPAIMGTRIIEDRKSRYATIMVLPLMSCGARLPIYALLIPAFFPPSYHGVMMWLIYVIGIVLAAVLATVLRRSILKGDEEEFLMELPPYRMPTIRGLFMHVWERSRLYLQKAGTVILMLSILLWGLTNFPRPDAGVLEGLSDEQAQEVSLRTSAAGRIGTAIEPVIGAMGFDHRIGVALIGALAAKEVFVAQMGIVYSLGQADEEWQTLRERIAQDYTPLQGFCIMLFTLISAPCVATMAITRRETKSWKWALFQFFGLTTVAYVITVIVYQVGGLVI
ncbi:MAG TPA: ferrous iron transport protein B [Sedimentisphaerales bacterium]|nr:ferrous iron transport protein B [Sedimentisphaerales bacterium]